MPKQYYRTAPKVIVYFFVTMAIMVGFGGYLYYRAHYLQPDPIVTKNEQSTSNNEISIWRPQKFTSVEELLTRPEEEFGVAEACLFLQKEVWRDWGEYDTDALLAKLDKWAEMIAAKPGFKDSDARGKIKIINKVLYDDIKWRYALGTCKLDNAIKEEKGHCLTLSLMYLSVCQRLRLPVKLVHIPLHVFLRLECEDGSHINIETTASGLNMADKRYIDNHNISWEDCAKDIMIMQSVSNKRAIVCYIQDIEREVARTEPAVIGESLRNRLIYNSIRAMQIAIKLDPECAGSYGQLACAMEMSRNLGTADIQESEWEKWEKKEQELINRNRERIRKNPPPDIPAKPRKKAA